MAWYLTKIFFAKSFKNFCEKNAFLKYLLLYGNVHKICKNKGGPWMDTENGDHPLQK